MSVLFLKRFLQRPLQVASIVPSSAALVRRVAGKMHLDRPRVIAEYGPGEGVHSREIVRRMHPESKLLLFELDPDFTRSLGKQFAHDARVHVFNVDAAELPRELARLGLSGCDYILSGIPFSILEMSKKRELLQKTYESLKPGGKFIVYQVTNELRQHATIFPRARSEYFLANIPPMFITSFEKGSARNGYNPEHEEELRASLSSSSRG